MKIYFSLLILLFISGLSEAQEIKPINLAQLENRLQNGKDTIFVINFWATFCKPCVRELPEFEKFRTEYSEGKAIKVILISTDLKTKLETNVKPFLVAHGVKGEVFLWDEKNPDYPGKIDPQWSGALPATLIYFAKSGKKKFHESAYTYTELTSAVQ